MFRNTKEFWYREKFRYSQDYDLYTLMLSAGKKIVNIPDFLVKYRVWSGAVSSSKTVYQFLFVRKIAKFYRQRRESGVDGYDSFNPKKILSFDLESLKDKELLEIEIKACWEFNDLKRLRQISLKYFKAHGFAGKITSYYVLSFLGQTIINLLRSLKRHFRR